MLYLNVMNKEKILISACLLGENCKYDGTNNEVKKLKELTKYYDLIPICPEVNGGLKTPRYKSEISNTRVITENGKDVTDFFNDGAYWAYCIAIKFKIKIAILKDKSPSCGVYNVYDGTFKNKLVDGSGITTKLLKKANVKVLNENEALKFLQELETLNHDKNI